MPYAARVFITLLGCSLAHYFYILFEIKKEIAEERSGHRTVLPIDFKSNEKCLGWEVKLKSSQGIKFLTNILLFYYNFLSSSKNASVRFDKLFGRVLSRNLSSSLSFFFSLRPRNTLNFRIFSISMKLRG